MTSAEHQLMFEMLKEQRMALAAIAAVLKSQGIIKEGDLAAYDTLLRANGERKLQEQTLAESYQGFARVLGTEVDLIRSTDALE